MTPTRIAFAFLFILSLLAACSKDDAPTTPEPTGTDTIPVNPPVITPPKDTLSTGWSHITSTALTSTLYDVHFLNNTVGYVCGDKLIAKSTDGGVTWTKLNIPTDLLGRYINMYFTDNDHGWIVSDEPNIMIRTSDGGNSWKKIGAGITNFIDVQFIDQQRGYLAANGLWKTSDSGNTWTKTAAPILPIFGLCFTDSLTGWINAPGKIMKTQNAGGSFDLQQMTAGKQGFVVIQFIDAQHGWTIGPDGIWKTTNGGSVWNNIAPNNAWSPGDVHFFNDQQGYIMSTQVVYKTTDGGTTRTQVLRLVKNDLSEMYFTDPQHGWVVGFDSGLYRYAP